MAQPRKPGKPKTAKKTRKAAKPRRTAKAGKARGTRKAPDPAARALDAALALAAERRWRDVALADIAAEAGVALAELYAVYPSKSAIVLALMRRTDRAVLAGGLADIAEEGPRDRLFEVLMRRFDALAPHKEGVASIVGDLAADPPSAACAALQMPQSMSWMLEAAGIDPRGPAGFLRAEGLSAVWLWALRAWFADDSPDMARTMAALDRALRRAEWLAGWLPGGGRVSA